METVPSFAALFQLMETNSAINVLSAPDLLTLDNQDASIMVGENVPFITQSAVPTYNLTSIISSVQRQNVGVKVKITPTINSNNYISLKIKAEISAIIPSPDGLNVNLVGPTTSKRLINTTILLKNNQTVIIGGLIQNNVTNTTSGIPLLSDIPILGYLFKTNQKQVQRDNLVILISPKIISTPQELGAITGKKKNNFYKFMKQKHLKLPGVKKIFVIKPDFVKHKKTGANDKNAKRQSN